MAKKEICTLEMGGFGEDSLHRFRGVTLPETNSSHLKIDGWKTIVSFWVPAYFLVAKWLLVLGRLNPLEMPLIERILCLSLSG